jgi:hypothetical protein
MPHLDANALENDATGMAFLRDVLGKPSRRAGSWNAAPTLLAVLPRRSLAVMSLRVAVKILAFALVVAAVARSRASAKCSPGQNDKPGYAAT